MATAVKKLVLLPLLGLTFACSNGEPEKPTTTESGSTEKVVGPDVLARVEECEVDDETRRRIDDLAEELRELRRRFTEMHPSVIATRRDYQALQRAALEGCVEELQ
jgi:hypothetical protein